MDISVAVFYLYIFFPSQDAWSILNIFTLLSASYYFYSVFLQCCSIHTKPIWVALLHAIWSVFDFPGSLGVLIQNAPSLFFNFKILYSLWYGKQNWRAFLLCQAHYSLKPDLGKKQIHLSHVSNRTGRDLVIIVGRVNF